MARQGEEMRENVGNPTGSCGASVSRRTSRMKKAKKPFTKGGTSKNGSRLGKFKIPRELRLARAWAKGIAGKK